MRSVLVLVSAIAILLTAPVRTQSIPQSEVQDRTFGWMRPYAVKGPNAPLTVDHRVYTPAQLTVTDNFATWMQQSYVPVGGLGEVVRRVTERLGPYNQETKSVPQGYGAVAKIYTDLKYGATKNVELVSTNGVIWGVFANLVMGEPALALSTPEQYYFTLPTFADLGFGTDLEKAVDLSRHPVLGRYPSWFARNSVTGNQKMVVLSKDNRLPYVKLTRGEYLDALAAAIAYKYERERFRITEANQGIKERIARDMVSVDARQAKRVAALAAAREKYKTRLQEVAEIETSTPDIALENRADAFLGTGGSKDRLPVYKVDPALAAAARTGGPQWIVVYWTAQLNMPVSKRLHDAIVNNFNFEYVHDYYFAPEKVTGRSYAPLNNPAAAAPVATAAASAASKTRAADPNVHFFEDFSTTPVGKPPIGWKSTFTNTGASSVVATLDGVPGQWATTAGFALTPSQLKMPLPPDFTISYDLVASANYTWGASGMTFRLSNGPASRGIGNYVAIRIRPGSGTADGEAVFEYQFPKTPGYSGSKYLAVPGFSSKAQSTVAVTIVKQGERLQVFLNKVKAYEAEKSVPAGLLFDQLSLDHQGTYGANDRMYIGNLTVLKK